MTCRDSENLLAAEVDGVLDESRRAELAQHLAGCAECRAFRATLQAAGDQLRREAASVAVPDADLEWERLRGRLREEKTPQRKKRPLAPVIWLGSSLAAAAALAFVLWPQAPASTGQAQVTAAAEPTGAATAAPLADTAGADFVEAGDANAATMVYVDKDSGWLVVWASDDDTAHG